MYAHRPFPSLRLSSACALLALAGLVSHVQAEDIDIYGSPAGGGASNLVIVLDNAGASNGNAIVDCPTFAPSAPFQPINRKTNFGYEVCGLYGGLVELEKMLNARKDADPTVTQLPMNLGLMYFPRSAGTVKDGGEFALPAMRSGLSVDNLVPLSLSGIQQFKDRVVTLSTGTDQSNNNQFSQALQESFAFYNGLQGLSGVRYGNPPDAAACTRNFVVYITLATNNQKPQDAGDAAKNALRNLTGSFTELTLPSYTQPHPPGATAKINGNYQADPSDEWSKFMAVAKVGDKQYNPVTAYTIILYDGSNAEYEQLMANVATQSGTKVYYVPLNRPDGLAAVFGEIARQVMAVNSVFAAPVLPVSANSQGTYANQVFMGMFRPDGSGLPRWMGNLKQYQFGLDETDKNSPVLYLGGAELQANGQPKPVLSSAGTGFLDPSAISFWTSKNTNELPDKAVAPKTEGGFWLNAVARQGGLDGYDLRDGHIVEKGGVGQQIRLAALTDISKRNVYTCLGTGCTGEAALSGMKFDAGNAAITSAALGTAAADATARTNLINWARGEDVAVTRAGSGAGPEMSAPPDASIIVRGSVHGDVLHSRPAVLNYQNYGTVVFYGANDGTFRAVNGNQPNNPTNTAKPIGNCKLSTTCAIATKDAAGASINVMPGGELWSFVPEEFFGGLKRIYDNTVALTLGEPASTTRQPKTYFFDGSPGVYQNGDTAYLFLSARRGGRLLYALDVSDPTNPKFMWKITPATTGFGELGQTWSQPKVATVKGHHGPVLIFGAGYDSNQDNEPVSAADSMGRGIFVVDAKTGALLWRAGPGGGADRCTGNPCLLSTMTHSIPGDITLVDRDFDGKIDRLYAADMGGNLWRADLQPDGTGAISTWKAYQFAALGGSGSPKRKFFFPPDVVVTKNFDAVVAVSGDREHPLPASESNTVVNRFYMIKDTQVGADGSGWDVVRDNTTPDTLVDATNTSYDGTQKGFYITLAGAGEKGVNAPTTFGGSVFFGTNRPLRATSLVCQPNLGEARGYSVNFLTGVRTSRVFDGGGLPPSPVAGIVEIERSDGSKTSQPFVIGGGGGQAGDGRSALGAERPDLGIRKNVRRTYWNRVKDR